MIMITQKTLKIGITTKVRMAGGSGERVSMIETETGEKKSLEIIETMMTGAVRMEMKIVTAKTTQLL